MPELPSTNEPGAAHMRISSRRRLSGCAWVVICVVLIAATTAFMIGWPIYRANVALAALKAKGAQISHSANIEDRPWYLNFVDESVFVPGVDGLEATLEGEQFTDGDVQNLAAIGSFEILGINRTSFTIEGLRGLADLRNVGDLWIDHPDLSDDHLRHILQPHWQMYHIALSSPKLTQKAWESIVPFKELDYVFLHSTGMTLEGTLPDLSSLKSLKIVGLKEVHITAGGVKRLATLPAGLRHFHLHQCRLSSVDFSMFPSLRSLNIWGCDCTATDMNQLRIPSKVTPVRLNDLSLVGSDPKTLATLSQVILLELKRSTFTDEHLHALASCTKLKELNLTGCQHVGDEQIPLLLAIPNLQRLDLTDTSITAAGIESLRTSSPKLKVIHDVHQP